METQQQTLDSFIKNRKRPTTDDNIRKKEFMSNAVDINKPSRKLSFDDSGPQIIKKQKVN